MKRASALFLQFVIVLIGLAVFTGLIWLPPNEGRAANLDLISIYTDPFIIYIYTAFISFFIGLYQAFTLVGYFGKKTTLSPKSAKALRNIKYCAFVFIGFIVLALPYMAIMAKITHDDGAGGIAMGVVMIFASCVTAAWASLFEKRIQTTTK